MYEILCNANGKAISITFFVDAVVKKYTLKLFMSPTPRIITASPENWCDSATKVISSAVKSYIKTKGECSLMLTGGNTVKKLYHHWFVSQPWDHRKIRYYFGDERCVTPEHQESNFGMVRKTLFPEGIPDNGKVMRMEGELSDRETAAKNYERMLPNSLDILLLSVGPDGHIVSLFPPELHT